MSSDIHSGLIDGGVNRVRRRRTLAGRTGRMSGIGLHSGVSSWMSMDAAPAGTGVIFRDHHSRQEIPALVKNVFDTTRCTQLHKGEFVIQTVEHALSALRALDIDDVIIEVMGGELPICDGSAAPIVEAILSVGVIESDAFVEPFMLCESLCVTDDRGGSLRLSPASELQLTVTLEYPNHPYIGTQSASYSAGTDDYKTEIAPARTFGFLAEIDQLRARGLGLGASYDNVLVLGDDDYVSPRRFANEMARHKLLDLYGDLALLGRPFVADVVAVKPGHSLNSKMAALLAEQIEEI